MTQNPAAELLRKSLGNGAVFDDAETLRRASIDNSRYFFSPDAVVMAKSAEDVSKTLKIANGLKCPVTVRGAGSGCAGGALPFGGGIVLDLEAINFIEIDPVSWVAHVGAGAINADVDAAAEKCGLMYPPDPSSKKYSTIGGNIACNAGGLRAAKYGTTRDYVMALSVCLPNGEIARLSRPLRKFATGMNLRDLVIGSEGSLGVVVEAWLKLVARPEAKRAALAFFKSDAGAFACVRSVLSSGLMPAVMEFMDADSVECAAKFKGVEIGRSAALLIELDGTRAEVAAAAERLEGVLSKCSERFEFADDEERAERLWEMRRACSPAMFLLGGGKLNQDIVLPILKTDEFFEYFKELSRKSGLPSPTFGHAADGNYHIHFMYDPSDAAQKKAAYESMDAAIIKAVELGGAVSGEHGIGITKHRFLRRQIAPAELDAMLAVKRALDPNGILNAHAVYGNIDIAKYDQRKDIKLPWDK